MNLDSLEFRIAESRLQHLETEMDAILAAHREANACHECETKIGFSLDAYQWITRAEEAAIIADREGLEEFTPPQYQALAVVYQRWLMRAELIARLAESLTQAGYQIERLAEFRECHEGVKDWVARNEFYEQSKAARDERFAQEPW